MSEHTKAPWNYQNTGANLHEIYSADGKSIATCWDIDNGLDSEANARHIVHCVNNHERLVEALDKCVAELERNTCLHEETYRAGVIWEICSQCGHKWADDEGGKPEITENPVVESCRALLAALEAERGGEL